MHQLALAEKNHVNGSLKTGLLLKSEPDEDMDTDQILDKLIEIQVGSATRDEVLRQLRETVTKIDTSLTAQNALSDRRYVEILDDSRATKLRLKVLEDAHLMTLHERVSNLEKSGLRGFLDGSAAKRLGTLIGIVLGLGGSFALVTALVNWIKTHFHF